MSKANRCVNSIVKLSLLFSLVMAAIGLNAAPDSATLTVDGEVVHYGDWDSVKQQYKWPLTHRYTCGAVGTYSYTSEAKVGVFKLEFTEDATIQGECYTRTATSESYALSTGSSLEVYLNGHTVHVLPSGATTDETRGSWLSKIHVGDSGGSLKIYGGVSSSTGVGTLDIHHGYISSYNDLGIYGAIVNISEGNDKTEVTAIKSGVTGSLTVSDSHISISGYSKLIQAQHGFSCTGSMLDLMSRKSAHGDSVSDTAVIEDGNYQIGGQGISFSGSVVSIVSEHPGLSGIRPRGELQVEDSCVAIVSDRSCFRLDGYLSSSTGRLTFRNARMTAISTTGNVLSGAESDSEKSVATFGSGEYVLGSSGNKQGGNLMDDPEYYLNPEGKIAALVSGRIAINGGNLEICAPNAYGCDTSEFTMKNGSLKMVDSIDHDKTVHAILDETAVKETVSANARFAGWTAEHSQMLKNMLAHQDAAGVGAFAGRAGGVIETKRFFQSGGRIDEGTALHGCFVDYSGSSLTPKWITPAFTGGSLKVANFRYIDSSAFADNGYHAIAPTNALGQTLMRVDYEPYWIPIPPLSGSGSFGFPTMAQLSGGLYSAWSKPLVLRSTKPYYNEYAPISTFKPGDSPYVQCLVANFGSSMIALSSMKIEILSSDGTVMHSMSMGYGHELEASVAESIYFTWVRFKGLAEGCYILRMTLDPDGQMQDSYRGDNVVTCPFTVASSDTTMYSVTYRSGAYGVGSEQTATKLKGVDLTLEGAIFTRNGYKQTGWSVTDGGAKAYDLKGIYATDAEIVLYPYWVANSTEPVQTFAEALGVPELECAPWGSTKNWQLRIDPDWTCDGNGSATVGNNLREWTATPGFSFNVTGPTQMKFSYSKSFSSATFSVDCTAGELYRDDTPGEKTDWKQVVLDIPAGAQTVYFKVRLGDAALHLNEEYDYNGFWIDDLQFGEFEHDEPDPTEYHTVTFDLGAHGERTGGGELSQTVMDGEAATPPEFVVVDGWTFAGWNTSFDSVTSDLMVTALWKRKLTDGFAEFAEPYTLVEEGGTLCLDVLGGSSHGPSSVKLYLAPESATAKDLDLTKLTVDGVAVKNAKFPLTLSWAAGDVSEKVIEIPIKTDTAVEGYEQFDLQLADANGIGLGDACLCSVSVKDETVGATLAQAVNNPLIKVATTGDGKWIAANGNEGYIAGDRGMYHLQSPALASGKSSTLNLSGVSGSGQIVVAYRFVGDYTGGKSASLRLLADKKPLKTDTVLYHSSIGSEWKTFTIMDDNKGSHTYSYVFTQGDDPDVHVEVAMAKWVPAGGSEPVMVYVSSNGSGYGTVSGMGFYAIGATAKITAKPAPGRQFAGWYKYSNASQQYELYDQNHMTLSIKVTESLDLLAMFFTNPYVRAVAVPADGGKVSGSGYVAVGKKVTLKATANKNFTFEGWYASKANDRNVIDESQLVATTASLVIDRGTKPTANSKTSTTVTDISGDVTYFAKFKSYPEAFVSIEATDGNVNAGKITGTGKYAPGKKVTLKATANKGYVFNGWYAGEGLGGLVTQAASYSFSMPSNDVSFTAKFVTAEEDRASIAAGVNGIALSLTSGQETASPLETNVMCGVYLEWPVAASALSEPTVAVSGLPAGLKFTAKPVTSKVGTGKTAVTVTNVPPNTIYGAPTAASKTDKSGNVTPSKVKVTVTTAGKSKAEYVIDLTIDPLPAWAQGEFSGLASTPEGRLGSASMSVTAAGKVSGKVIVNGTNCTFSAANYDITSKTVGETNLVAVVTGKFGKDAVTGGITVVASGASGSFAGADMSLHRNVWKDKGAKPVPEEYQGTYSVKLGAGERGTGYLSLTVDKKGAVKVAGKAPDGTALSATATLMPGGDGAYFTDVFAAPSAYKGGYVAGCVGWGTDGRVSSDGLDWTSFNPESTADYYAGGFNRGLSASGVRYEKTDAPKTLGVADVRLETPVGATLSTFSFTQSTGIWKGTLLWDFGDPSLSPVKVPFEGIMVQGEDLEGFGTYDVQSSYVPYDKTGKPQREKSYKVKESISVGFIDGNKDI